MMKVILTYLLSCVALNTFAQDETQLFAKASKDITDVIVHDVFSPPVAARIYLYSGVALYEAVLRASGEQEFRSLSGQLNGLKDLPNPKERISPAVAGLTAFYSSARHFVFSEDALADSFKIALNNFSQLKRSDPELYNSSVAFGREISDSIFQWSRSDNYAETRKRRRFTFSKGPGKWVPTPPAYLAAIEPFWGDMRPAVNGSSSQCRIADPATFSTDTSAYFFHEAMEVYNTKNHISEHQNLVANFWDCNPFNVNTNGHLMFALKKLSPGGHWMNIATIAATSDKANLLKASAAYTLTAIAIYDAFIPCWAAKYRTNLIRPETFINNAIDASWRPVLQTPPFPEYPSGHSVVSMAAATVLTDFFGKNFSFADDTEIDYNLPVRKFVSFEDAAEEAAISRLYGGIHYREAIENGKRLGRDVGMYVLDHIKIHRK